MTVILTSIRTVRGVKTIYHFFISKPRKISDFLLTKLKTSQFFFT